MRGAPHNSKDSNNNSYQDPSDENSRLLAAAPKTLRAAGYSLGGSATSNWIGGGTFFERPGLQSFAVEFAHGDEHLRTFRVDTNHYSSTVTFQDRDGADDFYWEVVGVQLPVGTFYTRHDNLNDVNPVTGCHTVINTPRVGFKPIVQSWNLYWDRPATDHHIDRITVRTLADDDLLICYHDSLYFLDNDDDGYRYIVELAWIPDHAIAVSASSFIQTDEFGHDAYRIGVPPEGTTAVIRGFSFDYSGILPNDNHIERIAVDVSAADGRAVVFYGDEVDAGGTIGGGDNYEWIIDYLFITS